MGPPQIARLMDSAKYHESFISYRSVAANYTFIQKSGIEEFARLEMEKRKFLRHLIESYDEGRSKSFYIVVNW